MIQTTPSVEDVESQDHVLPGPMHEDPVVPAAEDEERRSLPAWRSGWVINGVIVLAVLVVLALSVYTLRSAGGGDEVTTQTATVSVGEVSATVSANGNVAAASDVNVNFQGTGGVVTEILVQPGDRVHKGQLLAVVDDISAQLSLDLALTQLSSARAAYAAVVQGQTAQEKQRDTRSVDQARVGVTTAQTSLQSAQDSLHLTQQQQDASVQRADAAVRSARATLRAARAAYIVDPTPEHKQARDAARTALATAKSAQVTAHDTRATMLLQGRQQVDTTWDQLAAAQASLNSAQAGVAVNQQPPRASAVDAAQAQAVGAEVSVAQAQTTLDQTRLRAPVRGTVAEVNGTVGESSSSTSGGSSRSSQSDSTSTEGGAEGTTGSSSTSSSTGFIMLTDTRALQVTADVAEADIAAVRVGQHATVTLSASRREIDGLVTGIDVVQTVTNNVVEYGVTVMLNQHRRVRLGQSAQVVITTGNKQDVVRVSSSALTTVGQRTTAEVVNDDGSTSMVAVVTGLEGDGYTQVVSGLSAEQRVVLPQQADTSQQFTFPGAGGLGAP